MNCSMKDQNLSLYIDGRLTGDTSLKIEKHVEACPVCREELLFLRRFSGRLKSLSVVDVSSSYDFEFRRRLAESEREAESRLVGGRERLGALLEEVERRIPRIRILQPIPVLSGIVITLLLLFAVSLPVVQFFQPARPRAVLAQGISEAYNPKSGNWTAIDTRFHLAKNSIIRTGESGKVDIEVPGKYKIRISENSEVELASLTGKRNNAMATYRLKNGRVIAKTEPDFKGAKIDIITENAEATVRGTKFLVDFKGKGETTLAVLEGEVEFRGIAGGKPKENFITVKENCQSTVSYDKEPTAPAALTKENSRRLLQSYSIGTPGRIMPSRDAAKGIKYNGIVVVVILPDEPSRAEWYLTKGSIWTNDKEPKAVNSLIAESERLRIEGEKSNNVSKYVEAAGKLEKIVTDYPDHRYNPQILLFAGAYYNVIKDYNKAVEKFDEIVSSYGDTEIASIAQYAVGMIYEERLNDKMQARRCYNLVLSKYPDSPEAIEAKNRLTRLETDR